MKTPKPAAIPVHPLWSAAKEDLEKIGLVHDALDDFAVITAESDSGKVTANILSILATNLEQAYFSLNDLLFREIQERHLRELARH